MLKDLNVETELVTEYVKDMIWEGRTKIFECQPYIFGKQLYKLFRVAENVDVIITDRPILLDAIYDPEQDEDFRRYILKKFNQFDNINVFLERVKPFNPNGRNENSLEEARQYDGFIKSFMDNNGVKYYTATGDLDGCEYIKNLILERIEIKNA